MPIAHTFGPFENGKPFTIELTIRQFVPDVGNRLFPIVGNLDAPAFITGLFSDNPVSEV